MAKSLPPTWEFRLIYALPELEMPISWLSFSPSCVADLQIAPLWVKIPAEPK
jgi:hypothetical protein